MLVDMAKRPISLIRCPQGRAKQCFFQKHDNGAMGPHVKHVPVKESDGDVQDYLYVEDARGILACVQMGTIEFHGWGSKAASSNIPTGWCSTSTPTRARLRQGQRSGAERLRDLLADLGLVTFPLLTGGKGIHVVAPLDASRLAQGEELRRAVQPGHRRGRAGRVHRQHPQEPAQGPHLPRLAPQPARRDRGDALFGQAREGAPVAAPIAWEELDKFKSGAAFSIRDADELIERAGSKLLAGWGKAKQKLPKA